MEENTQKLRTAEVTICIIPERTARSLPTVSELLKATKMAIGRKKKKEKTLRCFLSLHVSRGVCNEVWWRPYPTNLPPPSQRQVSLHVLSLILQGITAGIGTFNFLRVFFFLKK